MVGRSATLSVRVRRTMLPARSLRVSVKLMRRGLEAPRYGRELEAPRYGRELEAPRYGRELEVSRYVTNPFPVPSDFD